jgi:hypothetical protein
MKQKFFRGQRVRIAKRFPQCMSHFDGKGCEAIVDHSYSDMYGCGNFSDFCLLIIDKKGNYRCSWYPEKLLTLVSNDIKAGEKLLQRYREQELKEPE